MSQPSMSDPARLAAAREAVLSSMHRRHSVTGKDAWTLLAGGGVILLIFGWVFSFAAMILHSILAGWDASWRMHWYFLVYLLGVGVFLALEERRTRGNFFSFASSDVDLRRDPDNSAEYLLERSRTHLATLFEYSMWPARAVIAGYRGVRGIRQTGLDAILPEAADVLTRMLALDVGVKISELAPPGTDPSQLMPILKWLDTHDYIGFSTRGDKVWVSSPAKKRFAEDGVILPRPGAAVVPGSPLPPTRSAGSDASGPLDLAD